MQEEIWKDVPNYEGLYQVSNLGKVKSFKRKKVKILKSSIDFKGYHVSRLMKLNKAKDFKVHQLVAMAFLGHIPCGYKSVIDHINNNSLDNRVENLKIVTARENCSKDKINKTSKYTGVSWDFDRCKWRAFIIIDKKNYFLGRFDCELKARLVYQNKLKEILG